MPIDSVRTAHVFRPIEDRLVRAIAITEAALAAGDDPNNPASGLVGDVTQVRLAELKEGLATVRELIKAADPETTTLPERVQRLDALLSKGS